MDINVPFIKVALVGVTLIFLQTGCPSPLGCPNVVHQFAVTAQFTPQRDSVRVGDTLYLSSSFPTTLIDVRSGEQVAYSNAKDMGSSIFVKEIPANKSSLNGAVDSFSFTAIKGRIYNDITVPVPEGVNQLSYQQSGANYELLVSIAPRRKGVFCLVTGNGLSNGRPNMSCDKAAFDIRLINTNQHLYYLANYLGTSTVDPYTTQRGYCFKVY